MVGFSLWFTMVQSVRHEKQHKSKVQDKLLPFPYCWWFRNPKTPNNHRLDVYKKPCKSWDFNYQPPNLNRWVEFTGFLVGTINWKWPVGPGPHLQLLHQGFGHLWQATLGRSISHVARSTTTFDLSFVEVVWERGGRPNMLNEGLKTHDEGAGFSWWWFYWCFCFKEDGWCFPNWEVLFWMLYWHWS